MIEQQPEDIRVELATLLSNVDQGSAITTDQMYKIQSGMDNLWQKTEGDEAAHDLITQTWNDVVALAEQNAAQTFQIIAMGNMTEAALKEEKIAREELGNIQDALDMADTSHPALFDFVESIREDIAEDLDERLMEEIWPEAMESAFEDHHENLQNTLSTLTGFDWRAAAECASILEGFSEPTHEQINLLKALMAECDVIVRRRDVQRKADRPLIAQELKEWNERDA